MSSADLFDSFASGAPRVWSVPPSAPFLPLLARAMCDALEGQFDLSDAVVLLPTRRAARALADAFLEARGELATLLPRVRTLGDLDPEEAGLAELGEGLDAAPSVDPMARRFVLARLIRARDAALARSGGWQADPVAALRAADALSELIDSAELVAPESGFDWTALDTLVLDRDLARHWDLSTDFLKIVTEAWPQWLAATGQCDPGARQRRGIEALAARWRADPPGHAVVLAGSTGSIPATRLLMDVVARLPKGCVILPGLDPDMPDSAFDEARSDDRHPQTGLIRVLDRLGLSRADVRLLPGAEEDRHSAMRRRLLAEAMAPIRATADWRGRVAGLIEHEGGDAVQAGLDGLSLIEAGSEEEEATAIALALRAVLDTPGQTAALVTPDAGIGRRVAAKLARWGVQADISSGRPLSDTRAGSLIRCLAAWTLDPADPLALIGVMDHPLAAFGLPREAARAAAATVRMSLLSEARKDVDLAGLADRAARLDPKRWRGEPDAARDLIARLAAAADAAKALLASAREIGLHEAAALWAAVCERACHTGAAGSDQAIWTGEAGEALARLLAGLMEHGEGLGPVRTADAPRALDAMLQGQVVRPRASHPRLSILGPLEARLLSPDVMVLAGLDEGVWPRPPAPDPFLSPAMRAQLGLPSLELRIGLSAHDFAQLAAQRRVILTRSARRGDSPAVPSRWLWRLRTLLAGALDGPKAADSALTADAWPLALARAELPVRVADPGAAQPRPAPPVEARPMRVSATQVETWIRDPFRFYAEQILRLRALDPVGGLPGVAERGSAVHEALEIFAEWQDAPPDDTLAALRAHLRATLESAGFRGPALVAETVRLDASVRWAAGHFDALMQAGARMVVEAWGEAGLETKAGPASVFAKTDRIDMLADGSVRVVDYKTGAPPSDKEITTLFAAQLPVTALIVARGGYRGLPARMPFALTHIRIGGQAPGERTWNEDGKETRGGIDWLAGRAERTLVGLFEAYADQSRTYLSKPRAKFVKRVTYAEPFDRLARRAEWTVADDGEGDGE